MLLIVNADDFGYTSGVNRGVVQAMAHGVVSSASLMVNMPGTREAVNFILGGAVKACGVHLCLTAGSPVSPLEGVGSLVDGKGFFKKKEALWATEFDAREVRREFLAQIKRARDMGVRVTHLDTHHHVHEHPLVLEVLAEVAAECGLPVRATTAEMAAYLSQRGVPVVDFFWGSWFGAGATGEGFWEAVQEGLRRGVSFMEIMTHPGLVDGDLQRLSSYTLERERELAVLCQPSLQERLRENGVVLGSYGDLVALKGGLPA